MPAACLDTERGLFCLPALLVRVANGPFFILHSGGTRLRRRLHFSLSLASSLSQNICAQATFALGGEGPGHRLQRDAFRRFSKQNIDSVCEQRALFLNERVKKNSRCRVLLPPQVYKQRKPRRETARRIALDQ